MKYNQIAGVVIIIKWPLWENQPNVKYGNNATEHLPSSSRAAHPSS